MSALADRARKILDEDRHWNRGRTTSSVPHDLLEGLIAAAEAYESCQKGGRRRG